MKKRGSACALIAMTAALCGIFAVAHAAPVYKCTNKGRTEYSNEPCVGAEEIDVTPTQGIDKSTGQYRIGKNAQDERMQEAVNNALRPLTMLTKEQYEAEQRRYKLPYAHRVRCRQLDDELPAQKSRTQSAIGEAKKAEDLLLYQKRVEYRRLDC